MESKEKKRISIELIIIWICLTIVICFTIWSVTTIYPIKSTLENLDKISLLTQEYKLSWLYSCPDYVSNYYNCPENLKFMNITGKYCNSTLVCENKYIVSNITK